MKDFFISYNKADKAYALAINSWIEDAGYETVIQAHDFGVGSNFVLEMHNASREARKTIAILSPDYLASKFTAPEWAAAFADDPTGELRKLVPVRVRECSPQGLMKQIVYVDLVGLDFVAAQTLLLDALKGAPATAISGKEKPAAKRPKAAKAAKSKEPSQCGITQTATGSGIYQAGGSMYINQKPPKLVVEFTRSDEHITEEHAAELRTLINDLGDRDEKAGKGARYGVWMNLFKEKFGLTTYKALPQERWDEAVAWVKSRKGMQRPSLRRTNNKEWKKDHFSAIWGCAKKLCWSEDEVREKAREYFDLKKPVASLKDLGEQKLEKFAGYIKRQANKVNRL